MLILTQSSSFGETKPFVSMNVSFLFEVFKCIHMQTLQEKKKECNFINLLACNKCVENIDKELNLEEIGEVHLSDLPFSPILVGDCFGSQEESTSIQP